MPVPKGLVEKLIIYNAERAITFKMVKGTTYVKYTYLQTVTLVWTFDM